MFKEIASFNIGQILSSNEPLRLKDKNAYFVPDEMFDSFYESHADSLCFAHTEISIMSKCGLSSSDADAIQGVKLMFGGYLLRPIDKCDEDVAMYWYVTESAQ